MTFSVVGLPAIPQYLVGHGHHRNFDSSNAGALPQPVSNRGARPADGEQNGDRKTNQSHRGEFDTPERSRVRPSSVGLNRVPCCKCQIGECRKHLGTRENVGRSGLCQRALPAVCFSCTAIHLPLDCQSTPERCVSLRSLLPVLLVPVKRRLLFAD
jgi:hypothetical protein